MGTTLAKIRERIEALADDGGTFHLVCARTGERPVPADGTRFPDRVTARAAARATEQYRAALRRYDPRVPYYDVIACEEPGEAPVLPGGSSRVVESTESRSEPALAGRPPDSGSRHRIAFCHDVAAAVFEALSAGGHDAVESAVMDAYFDLAERLSDPDDLCLCLLESMAGELDHRLDARAQAVVLTDAAARLGAIEDDGDPVAATLERFQRLGLLAEFSQSSWSARSDGTRTAVVEIGAYALSPSDGRLPVLPLVLDLYRRSLEGHLTDVSATETADGWEITIELGTVERPGGIACASIGERSE